MGRRVDPLGELLQRSGVLDGQAVEDVLDRQQRTLPFASLCHLLGYADEETLVRALARQRGVRGVILEKCVIKLDVLDGVPRETYVRHDLVPVFEDERRLFVGVPDPDELGEVLRELEFVKGRTVIPLVGLQITLARTLRACFRALDQGERYYAGPAAEATDVGPGGEMVTVSEFEDLPTDHMEAEAHQAVYRDVTSEVHADDLVLIDNADEPPSDWFDGGRTDTATEEETHAESGDSEDPERTRADSEQPAEDPEETYAETPAPDTDGPASVTVPEIIKPSHLDRVPPATRTHELEAEGALFAAEMGATPRVLIVDSDYATRHFLVRELHAVGFHAMTARTGAEAVKRIKHDPPDLLILDVMLPEIDGFQICRSVKLSRRYRHIQVLLMSAVIDSGPVTDDVLRRHGADGYVEKPLDAEVVKGKLRELLRSRNGEPEDQTEPDEELERALELYRRGHTDEAIEILKGGIDADPLSAKHHFVLANLLQKKSMIYEAIDEYEATVDLRPDYFPALTRLAYLYYKQGFAAKAIDTWRRALPHCPDLGLRQNIEVFMRKLIAEMQL